MATSKLVIVRPEEIMSLEDIDPQVTKVVIWSTRRAIVRLPLIPSQVTKVALMGVNLVGPVRLPENLESLSVMNVLSEVPIHEWSIPSVLRKAKFYAVAMALDLRPFRINRISLIDPKISTPEILLPEGMTDLVLRIMPTHEVLPHLPSSLERLNLAHCPNMTDFTAAADVKIADLFVDRDLPFSLCFSYLERLKIHRVHGRISKLSLPLLEKLTLFNCEVPFPIEVNLPSLRELDISGHREVDFRGRLDDSLTTLTLANARAFPPGDHWHGISSLTINGVSQYSRSGKLSLPKLLWLKELNITGPVTANRVPVSNLEDYRRAWGLGPKPKPAARY